MALIHHLIHHLTMCVANVPSIMCVRMGQRLRTGANSPVKFYRSKVLRGKWRAPLSDYKGNPSRQQLKRPMQHKLGTCSDYISVPNRGRYRVTFVEAIRCST